MPANLQIRFRFPNYEFANRFFKIIVMSLCLSVTDDSNLNMDWMLILNKKIKREREAQKLGRRKRMKE